jgi:hypothetical protein
MDERIARLKKNIPRTNTGRQTYAGLSSGDNWNQIRKACTAIAAPEK